jgi:hypothetical protein
MPRRDGEDGVDGLTPDQALDWLAAQDLRRSDIPELVRLEGAAALAAARRSLIPLKSNTTHDRFDRRARLLPIP